APRSAPLTFRVSAGPAPARYTFSKEKIWPSGKSFQRRWSTLPPRTIGARQLRFTGGEDLAYRQPLSRAHVRISVPRRRLRLSPRITSATRATPKRIATIVEESTESRYVT